MTGPWARASSRFQVAPPPEGNEIAGAFVPDEALRDERDDML
jgi:hypothetical protein